MICSIQQENLSATPIQFHLLSKIDNGSQVFLRILLECCHKSYKLRTIFQKKKKRRIQRMTIQLFRAPVVNQAKCLPECVLNVENLLPLYLQCEFIARSPQIHHRESNPRVRRYADALRRRKSSRGIGNVSLPYRAVIGDSHTVVADMAVAVPVSPYSTQSRALARAFTSATNTFASWTSRRVASCRREKFSTKKDAAPREFVRRDSMLDT